MTRSPTSTSSIAVFGGSFNPPHVGHVLATAYAMALGFDHVVAPVVFEHAFGKRLASFDDRLEMARLAFAPIPGVKVSDIERHLPHPNRTLQTLQALQGQYPGRALRLLTGSDVIIEAHKWHRFDEVRRLAPPLVLGRQGTDDEGDYPCVLPEVSSTEVRERLAHPHAEDEQWLEQHVPSVVLGYIESRSLFAPC